MSGKGNHYILAYMYQELFQDLGLSQNEARIYEILLREGELTVPEISLKSGIHRRNAYDTIERLITKGMAFSVLASRNNKYNAVDPAKLIEIIREKERRVATVLPELERKFRNRIAPAEAYIYKGLEGQKNIWSDVLRVGETSYFVGAKGSWFDKRISEEALVFFKKAKKRKIKFVQLFDFEARSIPNFPKHFPGELEYRFLPKECSTNSVMHIFGDYVVTYTGASLLQLDEHAVFFVLRSRQLADSYRSWFGFMWKSSSK
jgi:sugar-specific transcriptional regulator TrmB